MSVKRWKETESWGFTEGDCMAVMEECADGEYVLYSDYASLKAEVERLRASSFVTAVPIEQYERVIKAGSEMSAEMRFAWLERIRTNKEQREAWLKKVHQCLIDWEAAKEGKPSV